jgi:hypothetical protein
MSTFAHDFPCFAVRDVDPPVLFVDCGCKPKDERTS